MTNKAPQEYPIRQKIKKAISNRQISAEQRQLRRRGSLFELAQQSTQSSQTWRDVGSNWLTLAALMAARMRHWGNNLIQMVLIQLIACTQHGIFLSLFGSSGLPSFDTGSVGFRELRTRCGSFVSDNFAAKEKQEQHSARYALAAT